MFKIITSILFTVLTVSSALAVDSFSRCDCQASKREGPCRGYVERKGDTVKVSSTTVDRCVKVEWYLRCLDDPPGPWSYQNADSFLRNGVFLEMLGVEITGTCKNIKIGVEACWVCKDSKDEMSEQERQETNQRDRNARAEDESSWADPASDAISDAEKELDLISKDATSNARKKWGSYDSKAQGKLSGSAQGASNAFNSGLASGDRDINNMRNQAAAMGAAMSSLQKGSSPSGKNVPRGPQGTPMFYCNHCKCYHTQDFSNSEPLPNGAPHKLAVKYWP
jgi:hypothetical protein